MAARHSPLPDARTFWKRLPSRSRFELLGAVALLFSSLGFITDLTTIDTQRPGWVVGAQVVYAGLIAVCYALAFLADIRMLFVAIALQFAGLFVLRSVLPGFWDTGAAPSSLESLRARALLDAIGILACVITGYALFIRFITREGVKHVRLGAEAELALAVQARLVPPLARRWGRFEIAGVSSPSSEIGGDLVDLFEMDGRAVACLADVSGHGIPAGSLMGMVKTATRMSLHGGASLGGMLTDVNRVLGPLKTPDRFVTLAAIELRGEGGIEVALAGHLPVLHVRPGAAPERIENRHLPLGVLDEGDYDATGRSVSPGDLLAIVSDGITEVVDAQGVEWGLEGVERLLAGQAGGSAGAVADALLAAARQRGPQEDDQSVLVIRVI